MAWHRTSVEHAEENNHVAIKDRALFPVETLDKVAAVGVDKRQNLEFDGGERMFVVLIVRVDVERNGVENVVTSANESGEVLFRDVEDKRLVKGAYEPRVRTVDKAG